MVKKKEVEKESNVVELFNYIALCPECSFDSFHIITNGPRTAGEDDTVTTTGIECASCKHRMNW